MNAEYLAVSASTSYLTTLHTRLVTGVARLPTPRATQAGGVQVSILPLALYCTHTCHPAPPTGAVSGGSRGRLVFVQVPE